MQSDMEEDRRSISTITLSSTESLPPTRPNSALDYVRPHSALDSSARPHSALDSSARPLRSSSTRSMFLPPTRSPAESAALRDLLSSGSPTSSSQSSSGDLWSDDMEWLSFSDI
ncbi:hypothetical protein JTE90_016689 [Oedothorax gibbosus]|uniref:Uncharacterized protein n=1 Tax=Oedothorax gibbosus TaxID=931172 RepID=A0AAV6TEV3_9ARAC|nr:hypothetical protein JTE90_016689 [Oedothorax gibbosus]